MTNWNPNSPCAQGLEWGPRRQVDRPITGRGASGYAWSLDSSAQETVRKLWTFSNNRVTNALDLIDIYDVRDLQSVFEAENVVEPGPNIEVDSTGRNHSGAYWGGTPTRMLGLRSGTTFPTGINNMADLLGRFGNLTPAVYQAEWVGSAAAQTFLSEGPEGGVQVPHQSFLGFIPVTLGQRFLGWEWGDGLANTTYPFKVSGLETGFDASPPNKKRVLALSASVLAQKIVRSDLLSEFGNWPVVLRPFITPDTNWATSGRAAIFGPRFLLSTAPETYQQVWGLNPFTGQEWTPAELASFGTAHASATDRRARVGWRIRSVQTGVSNRVLFGRLGLLNANIPREYGAAESIGGAIFAADFRALAVNDTRVAVAVRSGDRRQKVGWNSWDVLGVDGNAWQKEAGRQYLFHQVVDEEAYGPGGVSKNLDIRALAFSELDDRSNVAVQERIPSFSGPVPSSVGEPAPWAPAVVLEVDQ